MADKNVNINVGVKGTEQAQSKLGSLVNFIKSKFVVTFGDISNIAKSFYNALKNITDTAAESELALNRLNQAMKNNGTYTSEAYDAAVKYSKELQNQTVYDDEAIIATQTLINSLTQLTGEGLNKTTAAAADLASAIGIDLQSAASLLAKSISSDINALGRYGIQIQGTAGSANRLQSALDAVSRKFGGRAQSDAETYAGKVLQLKNSFDDLKETLATGSLRQGGLVDRLNEIIKAVDSYFVQLEVRRIAAIADTKKGLNTLNEAELKLLIENINNVKFAGLNKEKVLKDAQYRLEQIQHYGRQTQNTAQKLGNEDLAKGIDDYKTILKDKKISSDLSIQDEIDYWTNILNNTKKGTELYKQIYDEIATLKLDKKKQEDDRLLKAEEEYQNALADIQKRALEDAFFAEVGLTKRKNDLILSNNLAQMRSVDDLGRYIIDSIKQRVIGEITIEENAAIAKASMALATSIATLNFAGIAAAAGQLAVPSAIAGAKIAAVNAVNFAQGGQFVTQGNTYQSPAGQSINVGEAGKELVDVTPIGKQPVNNESPLQVNISIDGREIAKSLYPYIRAIDKRVI